MTITMEQECKVDLSFDYQALAREIIEAAIEAEDFPYEAEVNILLVDKEEIQKINFQQRSIDKPTDVLSFPMIEYDSPGDFSHVEEDGDNFNPDTGEALLGDIILCVPKIQEQAAEYGHSERREYGFLLLHSMLHLFGYDHMTREDAQIMETKQNNILTQMNILR